MTEYDDSDIDPRAAQQLFQAIVTQALIDATSIPKPIKTKPIKSNPYKNETIDERLQRGWVDFLKRQSLALTAAKRERDEARNWLLRDMESFPQITSLAGYEPTDIRQRAKRLAASGWIRPKALPDHALAA